MKRYFVAFLYIFNIFIFIYKHFVYAIDFSSKDATGKFGKVQSLDIVGKLMILEDYSNDSIHPPPNFHSIVSVTATCKRKQCCANSDWTLIVQDDPRGASNISYEMKIVIRSNETSENLQPNDVEKLLNEVRTGAQLAVKGRVEELENEDCGVVDQHCEMIKFKLVVDSDHHSLVYLKQNPKYTRQFSQPWWTQECGDTGDWKLKTGSRIAKTAQRVFCDSIVKDEEILNYVVAFKNCKDGEIFVGVKKDGLVTGRKFTDGEMANWRENLSKKITNILPVSKEGGAICSSLEEACNLVHERKCFVCVLRLSDTGENQAECNYIAWINVPKGEEAPVYFRKETDVHAFLRKGAENLRITKNYDELLFSPLYSLGSRRKPREISDEDLDIEMKFKEAIGDTKLTKKYMVLEEIPVR